MLEKSNYEKTPEKLRVILMIICMYVELDILTKCHRIKAKSTAVRDIARKSLVHINHRASDDMNMIRSE